jgi:hypothetical protein
LLYYLSKSKTFPHILQENIHFINEQP